MTTKAIEPKTTVVSHYVSYIGLAQKLAIIDQKTYDAASLILDNVKANIRIVKDKYGPSVNAAHLAHKRAKEMFNEHFKPLEESKEILGEKLLAYVKEKERQRKAEEAKAQALLDQKKAEEDARLEAEAKAVEEQALAAEAEKLRFEEEAKAAEEKGQAEVAEQLRLEAEAKAIEEKSKADEAAQLREDKKELIIPEPYLESKTQLSKDQSIRKVWKARVVDIKKVPRYLDEEGEALPLLVINTKMIDDLAKSSKGSLGIPGIEFYEDEIFAHRSSYNN